MTNCVLLINMLALLKSKSSQVTTTNEINSPAHLQHSYSYSFKYTFTSMHSKTLNTKKFESIDSKIL